MAKICNSLQMGLTRKNNFSCSYDCNIRVASRKHNIFHLNMLLCNPIFLLILFGCFLLSPNSALNMNSYYLPSQSKQRHSTLQQPLPNSVIQYRTALAGAAPPPAAAASLLSTRQLLPQQQQQTLQPPQLPPLLNVPSLQQQQQQQSVTTNEQEAPSTTPTTARLVPTTSGRLSGRIAYAVNGAVVAVYLGVPFAKPPVGELRFRKPEPYVIQPTARHLNATTFAPLCAAIKILPNAFDFVHPPRHTATPINMTSRRQNQHKIDDMMPITVVVSEDCLYLNVYVPTSLVEAAARNGAKVPVMVWIPGGDWSHITGAQNQIDAVQFAAQAGVVVVTINYRVGPFGFLTTNDKALPGNYGLYDQAMAILWVRRNIENFGGDADEITLFGHSSGAMSISWHLFSSALRNGANESIFKRAILQSGAYIGDLSLSLTENSGLFTTELGTRLNCHTENSLILAECLRRVPEEALRRVAQDIAPFGLGPVVDGEYIEDDPFNMLYARGQEGVKINAKDVMIGTVLDEGSLALEILPLLTATPQDFMQFGLNQSEFDNLARLFLTGWLPQHRSQPHIYDLIVHKYKNFRTGPEAMQARRQNFMDLVGDVLINMGVDLLAEKLSESGVRVFAYQFQHRPSWSQYPTFIRAGHGDELAFVFGAAHDLSAIPAENMLSDRIMRAWSQFASKGDPNPLETYIPQSTWLPYGPILRHFYVWDLQLRPEKALQNDLRAADIEFWYNIRARLGNFIQQCHLAAEVSTTPQSFEQPTTKSAAQPEIVRQQPALPTLLPPSTGFFVNNKRNFVSNTAQEKLHNTTTQLLNEAPSSRSLNILSPGAQPNFFADLTEQTSPTDVLTSRQSQFFVVSNKAAPSQTPFYQLPPPQFFDVKKNVAANLQANVSTTSSQAVANLLKSNPAALHVVPAAASTSTTTTTVIIVDGKPKAISFNNNSSAWQSAAPQFNTVVKRARAPPAQHQQQHHHVRASLQAVFSTTLTPAAADGESDKNTTSLVTLTSNNNNRLLLGGRAVQTHVNSNNILDSTLEDPPQQSVVIQPPSTDAIGGNIICAESGWLIGTELSTQQAEIIIGTLSVFSLTSLILIVLLCFAVTGQRRKLRRRKFLLAADGPKSATTTLYANHQQHHHQQQQHNGQYLHHHHHHR